MAERVTLEQLNSLRGEEVQDVNGDKIGKVEEIFVDEDTRQAEWIGIGTGFFGTKRVLVPVEGATIRGNTVQVPYPKDKVKDSPDFDEDNLDQAAEQSFYDYYGIARSYAQSGTGLPGGGQPQVSTGQVGIQQPATTEGQTSVTRSEEELRVGKMETEAGRVRIRKWVETQPVTAQVELQRETAYVQREPINQPASGAQIGEQEVEVSLRAEQPVVQKETVAKEQISVGKQVETEQQTISDEVRKEQIEVEGDARDVSR